jgi:hypothetical protein
MNELMNEIKNQIIELLKTLPVCVPNSSRTQWVVRCPYCGDSSNQSHAHLSIKINTSDDSPIVYRCLKCDTHGLLNDTVLEEIGLPIDSDMRNDLKEVIKHTAKINKYTDTDLEKYIIPAIPPSPITKSKLDYLNNRLGTHINEAEAHELKLILDFEKFIDVNGITFPDKKPSYIKFINYNFIGSLSYNNNLIVFRNLYDKADQRFIKLKLNPSNINPGTFYSIPNSIDLMYTNDIKIHIAEGVFDILSIYKNVNKSNLKDNFYFAACGFGYLTTLKTAIMAGLNTGLNVHLWIDNDKTDDDEMKILRACNSSIGAWYKNVYFHRNTFPNEKDFGVPLEKIIDTIGKYR